MSEAVDAGTTRAAVPALDGAQPHAHVGLLFGSDAEMLAGVVPFVEAGLLAGDLILVSCPPATVALITGALGDRAAEVAVDERICLIGTRVADATGVTAEWVQRARAARSGRLRLVTQVRFGTAPRSRREGLRYEAAVNPGLAGQPVSVLCLFDRRELPADVLGGVARTHPLLISGGAVRPSGEFGDQRDYVRRLPVPRESFEDAGPVFGVTDAESLAALRAALRAVMSERVSDPDLAEDLHFAASEIASNAFRHGARPVSAKVWVSDDRLVCAISDSGPGFDDPFTGFRPAHGDDLALGGMGLWLARKLWDHVDVLPRPGGVTVRLSTRLS
ncbi:sensor histidine kinase [Blastococcus saxobsidens]|uniref:Anti-sigma regulatory factor (Ser/Thr protein kinase) n=1 Tax=Blastococcus saxobsidens TaxID=138336 RepID=A0A4Q7YCJ9_9ACTN|nr:sensor histidine kinase [Blastococcus saxobsidens]RZU33905.1 anti-sigma regulatory factor (Ser/Thr protein kinase) [Blastococcus saxobsidens]